jgi:hypothetical protein
MPAIREGLQEAKRSSSISPLMSEKTCGVSEVGVDSYSGDFVDAHRLEYACQVTDVGWNYQSSACDFVSGYFGCEFLRARQRSAGLSDLSLTHIMHLRSCFHD